MFRAVFLWAFTYGDTCKENFSKSFSTSLLNWLLEYDTIKFLQILNQWLIFCRPWYLYYNYGTATQFYFHQDVQGETIIKPCQLPRRCPLHHYTCNRCTAFSICSDSTEDKRKEAEFLSYKSVALTFNNCHQKLKLVQRTTKEEFLCQQAVNGL
jgi:hypothetical protein